ncbi:MAG: FKBP-type peptidyl-prolyl cis-trans isomerase [Prevotellaceae bacterium]|jgi:FKBP-type peptidyl-prolyl cis-trans isomerase FklB|nr:FKBP-type peptidyl-prolyl cis-trans isomerase [Prevotellaceae bacterium]
MKKNNLFLTAFTVVVLFASCGKTYQAKDITLNSVNDSVNYAMGISYGNSLKTEILDTTGKKQKDFFKAVEKGYKSSIASLSHEEIQAYYQGIELGSNIKAQPFFGDSALKVIPKIAQKAINNTLLGKELKISAENAREVADRLFAKFRNDSLSAVPSAKELDSLNYAIGVSSASQMKDYYFGNDSSLKISKAYLKGLDKGLTAKDDDRIIEQGESLGVGLKQASSGAGLFGDSTILADKNIFIQAMINALAGKDAVFSAIDPQQYIQELVQKQREEKIAVQYKENKEAGEAFLAENAKNKDVVITESGLQYKIVKTGKGKKPTETDRVKVHYHGTLIDGTVFDSSVERKEASVFGLNQVIRGWTEALQLMPAGSKWILYIPQNLAYGSADQGTIKPFSTLIFEIELISIEK